MSDYFFGDPFCLEDLPLARPAGGYAVQYLGSDQLLDRRAHDFLPARHPDLRALYPSFSSASAAARSWREAHPEAVPDLAIVPAAFDALAKRHILIYGVLGRESPSPEAVAAAGFFQSPGFPA
ncbi:MAG: hypothetical protein LBU11_06850 [Zoogloeaceae bacterium]|jgi:hypothetical protein|nr:hypothetical protein [Zoogloeaceae bacterium]